jgi:hypothetical protein
LIQWSSTGSLFARATGGAARGEACPSIGHVGALKLRLDRGADLPSQWSLGAMVIGTNRAFKMTIRDVDRAAARERVAAVPGGGEPLAAWARHQRLHHKADECLTLDAAYLRRRIRLVVG